MNSFGPARAGATGSVERALAAARAALAADAAALPSLAALARAAGVSPRSLQRHCGAILQLSPHRLVETLRLLAAQRMLAGNEAGSVLRAAGCHGFEHPGRFACAYARAFGEPPSVTLRAARARARRAP